MTQAELTSTHQQKTKKTRKIGYFNMKGGQGKSTLSENIAAALAQMGHRVLLIELDMQRNASSIYSGEIKYTLTDVLTERVGLKEAMYQARENFYIIPADTELDTAANYIVSKGRRAYKILARQIEELTDFDFILFDHSPSWSAVSETAHLASEELLVPCELEPYAIDGILSMFKKLEEHLEDHKIQLVGIIPNRVNFSSSMTSQYLQQLKDTFKEKVTPIIRIDKQIPRSQAYRETIFEHNPKSKAAADIQELAFFIISAGDNSHA